MTNQPAFEIISMEHMFFYMNCALLWAQRPEEMKHFESKVLRRLDGDLRLERGRPVPGHIFVLSATGIVERSEKKTFRAFPSRGGG